MIQRSYDEKPTLFIVPTPIGNLEDITLRSINTLKSVDIIFCEDTRETLSLLNHYKIKKHLIPLHKFNEESNSNKLLSFLKEGKSIALVSDRGTPILSDPGNISVNKVIEEGYNVVSLPGATAAIPALTSSGLNCDRFLFYGFLESKSSKRKKELLKLKNFKYSIIFYEAPHRIKEMLNDIIDIFGDRNISVSREISKKYEEVYRGKCSQILDEIVDKGEFVVVVDGSKEEIDFNSLSIQEHVAIYIGEGYTENDAIKQVAKDRKVRKNDIYKEVKLFPGK